MEFRWVAALTLWTMLSGPILSQPSPPRPALSAAPRFVFTSPKAPTSPAPANALSPLRH
jgi:hypothetical protein